MVALGRTRRLVRLVVPALAIACVGLVTTPSRVGAATTGTPSAARVSVVGGQVAPQRAVPGARLPQRNGSVPVDPSITLAAPRGAARAAAAPGAVSTTPQVALRALVLAVDNTDFGVPTWTSTLDRIGAAYDVFYARTSSLGATTLIRNDGVGRYNAILLTSSALLYNNNGSYVSALSGVQWNVLWSYERLWSVRQVSLYTSYGTFPEDYCLSPVSEGSVGDTPLSASVTAAGAPVFDYLKTGAQIPIVQSYVYHDAVKAGCSAQPVLTAGSDVLGVLSTTRDGRQRLALTFSSNQYLMQTYLLGYGLVRWATRGLFLGEQRHYLNVDVDDWFSGSDERLPNGTLTVDGFQLSAHDAYNLNQQQTALRAAYPLAPNLTMSLAYNAGGADMTAGTTCSPNGTAAQLTATSRCLANQFRWINHTLDHTELDFTDYATTLAEIQNNLTAAATLGLPVPASVLKTPSYSGLGVYNPDPNDSINPPTDHGLAASNTQMLTAAKDAGVKYLHGNMSFASEVPSCFDCGIVHPLQPALTIVPDWPTNIWYFSTNPDEETSFYNTYYGPGGLFPYWPQNQTYAQLMDFESTIALTHVATGSVYTHTFHVGNVRDYGGGKTLLTDWLGQVLAKYSAYYSVPLINQGWPALADYASARTGHFAELAAGVDAVYTPATKTVTITSPLAGAVTVTGATTAGYSTYGSDVSALITLKAGTPVSFTPRVRA